MPDFVARTFSVVAIPLLLLSAGAERVLAAEPLTAGLEFSGESGRVTLDSGFSLAGRSFTVEAWVWLDSTAGDRAILAQPDADPMHLLVRDGRVHLGFWADDLTGATPVPAQEWVHVAFSYDVSSRRQRVFLNGVPDGERTADHQFAENNRVLEIGTWLGGNFLSGRMLELRIWDHARTAADIAAERFATPSTDAPGLDALFTFEGSNGTTIPEETGQLSDATLSGDVAVVEPVVGPAFLGSTFPLEQLSIGSLRPYVSGYTLSPAPLPDYADPSGTVLTNTLGPARVWGTLWLDTLLNPVDSILVWDQSHPAIHISLAGRARVDAVTLYLAQSDGAADVALPDSLQLSTPGGFNITVPVTAGAEVGRLQTVRIQDLALITEALSVTLSGTEGGRIALAEVHLEGGPLRISDPAPFDPAPRLARLYHGFDPALNNRDVLKLQMELVPGEAQVLFHRGTERLGAEAVPEWSSDLQTWYEMPQEINPADGRGMARFTMAPGQDRAFFRLRYVPPPAPGLVQPPADSVFTEDAEPQLFAPGFLFGDELSAGDAGDLELIALNDQTGLVGSTLTFDFGVTLRIHADGSGELTAPVSMPGHAVVDEAVTYTVVNALGESIRRTFAITVNGENNPPTVEDFTGSHATGTVDAGIAYRYFEGDFPTEESLLAAEPVATGRLPTFSLDPATADDGFGFEFTGELFVPAAGPYTFYTGSANGVVLDIDGERVVDNTWEDPATGRSGTITLAAGSHTLRVRYFDADVPGPLTVDYSGPGLPREPIPASAFPRLSDLPIGTASDIDDGDVLRISHLNGTALVDGAPAVLPSGASLTLAADGQITYVPAPGKTLLHEATFAESFTYTVTDSGGLSATGTASIDLARQNTAPTADGSTQLSTDQFFNQGDLDLSGRLSDADGDPLRIIGVGDAPLLGTDTFPAWLPSTATNTLAATLPSTATIYLQTSGGQQSLFYDGYGASVRTLSGDERYIDSFTLTVVDAAGATAELPIWIDDALGIVQRISYSDRRFDSSIPPRTVRLLSRYNFPVTAEIYVKHRQTGDEIGRAEYTLPSRTNIDVSFDLPEGVDLGEGDFFDSYDLEIDTLDGDPIYYGRTSGGMILTPLYSTVSRSFFTYGGASSPHWPNHNEIENGGIRQSFPTGVYVDDFPYDSIVTLYHQGLRARSSPANITVIEPTFAANIIIEGICRTNDISRFTAQNLNDEDIVLTVGNEQKQVPVPAGQTVEFDVNYLPRIPVKLLDGDLGLHYSSESVCPTVIDFSINSFCSDTFTSFTQVINNSNQAYTVRIESVAFPTLISGPVTIAADSDVTIQMDTQGRDVRGTEGRLVILLESGPMEGPTFTFSDENCF
ncbi:MAG: hypothetical protein JJU05_09115 [Verrucomicrobia bacterium]|nr:hypothetical protein [Verrucomicrobiota bacterium]